MGDINDLAAALVKLCPVELIAGLIDCTLSADSEPILTDPQADVASLLHDCLCERSPKAVYIAQGCPEPEGIS